MITFACERFPISHSFSVVNRGFGLRMNACESTLIRRLKCFVAFPSNLICSTCATAASVVTCGPLIVESLIVPPAPLSRLRFPFIVCDLASAKWTANTSGCQKRLIVTYWWSVMLMFVLEKLILFFCLSRNNSHPQRFFRFNDYQSMSSKFFHWWSSRTAITIEDSDRVEKWTHTSLLAMRWLMRESLFAQKDQNANSKTAIAPVSRWWRRRDVDQTVYHSRFLAMLTHRRQASACRTALCQRREELITIPRVIQPF